MGVAGFFCRGMRTYLGGLSCVPADIYLEAVNTSSFCTVRDVFYVSMKVRCISISVISRYFLVTKTLPAPVNLVDILHV